MAHGKALASRSKTKILAAEHTGRLRPHKHTSYSSLLLLILSALLPVLVVQNAVSADTTSGGGSSGVYAVVPSAVPSVAPTITNLPTGRVFTTNDTLNVTGNCPSNMLVRIFKNGVMAGTTTCHNGVFSVQVDLFIGSNSLVAQAFNIDNIGGPQSAPLTVKYIASALTVSSQPSSNVATNQFYIISDTSYKGASVDKPLQWSLNISGGQPPYSLRIGWGDGTTSDISRSVAGQFTLQHSYSNSPISSGNYSINIVAGDQVGQSALLQLKAVVPGSNNPISMENKAQGHVQLAWKVLAMIGLVVAAFFIGEIFELRHLSHHKLLS